MRAPMGAAEPLPVCGRALLAREVSNSQGGLWPPPASQGGWSIPKPEAGGDPGGSPSPGRAGDPAPGLAGRGTPLLLPIYATVGSGPGLTATPPR